MRRARDLPWGAACRGRQGPPAPAHVTPGPRGWTRRSPEAADGLPPMEESDEEVLEDMSEAAKCRIRNRASRKAREAAAMMEVMEEEAKRTRHQSLPMLLAVLLALACWWWWTSRHATV